MKEKRLNYLDYLRILAAISVIVLHVSGKYFYKVDTPSLRWTAMNLYDSIVRWGVPVFVMISGILFLNKDKPIKELYKKNILRIVIAFIFWSIIYGLYNYFVNDITIKELIKQIIMGPGHLWYLKMIVLIYMMVPLLKKIVEDKKIMKYFLVLTFIFSSVLPFIVTALKVYFTRFDSIFNTVWNSMNLNFILGFAFYFVFGYYLNSIKLNKKQTTIIYILGIIGFISTFLITQFLPYTPTSKLAMFYENYNVNIVFESMFVFVLVKRFIEKHNISDKVNKTIFNLSKYSFGIYLSHILVLDTLNAYGFNSVMFNTFFSIPIVSIVIILISFVISYILNKIPIINKYIV